MLDLETMGTASNAAIVSIGACVFDPHNDIEITSWYYNNINLNSCINAGLSVDGGAIEFWLSQSDEARQALLKNRFDLAWVINDFNDWFVQVSHLLFGHDHRVWSHGASFDTVILENAFRAVGRTVPWSYNAHRDTRTVFELSGINLKDFQTGTLHNALDDAISQAKAVRAAYRNLKRV
jgi:DNA polymerase III epsilon subunit-like protein